MITDILLKIGLLALQKVDSKFWNWSCCYSKVRARARARARAIVGTALAIVGKALLGLKYSWPDQFSPRELVRWTIFYVGDSLRGA